MVRRRKPTARALLIIVGVAVLASLAAVGVAQARSGFFERLHAAQTRWEARPFAQYRMQIEDESGNCRQDVEIDGERIVRRISNDCRIPPRTVSSLFRLIEGTPPSRYRCVEHRCACDTVMSVTTDYDPDLGYPQRIRFVWQVRTNWHHRDYWSYVWDTGALPRCRDTSFSRTIKVVSLTPLNE